ncbi:MAG: PadR family transcriptional regulator [Acholeplasmataceae bacterium]
MKVISKEDMYGFEVIKTLSNVLDINENTIYPILRRLTNQGIFVTYEKESDKGANRKYYQITKKGLNQLNLYLDEWNLFIKNVNKILGDEK